MHPGKQDKVADFDLEIQAVAEKRLGVHLPDTKIVAIGAAAAAVPTARRPPAAPTPRPHHSRVRRSTHRTLRSPSAVRTRQCPSPPVRNHDRIEKVRGADEIGDEPVARALIDIARRADLHDPPSVHDRDHVRQGERLGLIVGDVDGGEPELALNALEFEAHALAQLGVEVRKRLVEQEELRLHDERPRQGEALLLAARELGRGAVREIIERNRAQHAP